jgi:hypothetical protein
LIAVTAERTSSTFLKTRPWMACSFKVRLNRSATPLVCGSATKAKLGAMPQNLT